MNNAPADPILAILSDRARVQRALAEGVRDALLRHKRMGNPVVVWREGQIVWIPPEEIPDELPGPER